MSLPGFTAEAATAPALHAYGYVGAGGGAGGLVPAAVGFPFPQIRCCGYSQLLHRFVCVTRRQRPWESCQCNRTPLGDPFISCRDIVLTPD